MNNLYILLPILYTISFITTWIIRKIAIKKAILDIPKDRSSHSIPTPRGGGLAIVIIFYFALTILFIQGKIENTIFFALLSGLPLMIISIIDDIVSLSPKIRFIVQLFSSAMALYFLQGLHVIDIGFIQISWVWILSSLALIGMIWFINLYNFIDGIDGYASMEAIFVGGAIYLITKNEIALILVISTLGFLPWNWQKAKIFMGDVGSTVLGFFIAVLAIYFQNINELSIINWLILTSLFWFDATFTLFRRWKNKEKLSEAHKKHAYQRIVQAGFSHQKTTLYAFGINIIFLGLVIFNQSFPRFSVLSLLVCITILLIITKLIDKRKTFI